MKLRKMMFILIFILSFSILLIGCNSNMMKHDTFYKTNQHMKYSVWGYSDPNPNIFEVQSVQGGWWGDSYDIDGNLIEKW